MTTTLAHAVVTGLKEAILRGDLPPGAKLPSEPQLVEQYGVSRTVVREAVTRLRSEGLVETFHGRGSFVLALPEPSPFAAESTRIRTHDDVLAMLDFRIGVESEAAALAAHHRTPTDERAIRAATEDFGRQGHEGAVSADFDFHRAVAAATGNRFYLELVESLGPMMIMLPRTQLGEPYSMTDATHVERVQREHDAIADAVLAGDADTARAAMRVHLGSSRRRVGSTSSPSAG
ncbi:GntR family transcriptional regulator [Janibacter melonis]|uniref:GntR family transcriptional regulator n=1 Tax=Janibacter melonis TaxID=262209 RepID=A0A176QGJ9_9MICO|nr:FadR/GntR family transcriptional regulator [Janibacter melonis]OAB88801.1 GntR family transcriptional regulator [Janibacter melonis]